MIYRQNLFIYLFYFSALFGFGCSFYLPGVAPVDYQEGAPLEIFADKLSSDKEQIPFDYYSLPFCRPKTVSNNENVKSKHRNLGQILMGDYKEPTPYSLNMNVAENCRLLCSVEVSGDLMKTLVKRIQDDYSVLMNLDNMPVVVKTSFGDSSETTFYSRGYPIGYTAEERTYIYNHLDMKVLIHMPSYSPNSKDITNLWRIVGFEVTPKSIQHQIDNGKLSTCPGQTGQQAIGPMLIKSDESRTIIYSYSTVYEESPINWATRWDPLLKSDPELRKIQWFSLINSSLISLFLSVLVALVLLRTVFLDFSRYNNLEDREEVREDSGWKLVHGDVFRSPPLMALLAIFVGSGAQVLCLVFVTLLFAVLGMLSPANRGGLLTGLIVLWVLTGTASGFVTAKVYSDMQGTRKFAIITGSILLVSGTVFGIFFVINLLLWWAGSSAAVSFWILLVLMLMWFLMAIPLQAIGGFVGFYIEPTKFPVKTSNIPRDIPNYLPFPPDLFTLLTGLLPFGVVYIDLIFIYGSIWQNQWFYMFGFLFVAFILLIVTSAEVSAVLTYVLLTKEDYRWWWRSFFSSGICGLYVFIYSLVYLYTQPSLKSMHFTSGTLYLGYSFIFSLAFFLMTGCIGFYCSYFFVRSIFNAIHID